ncbi:hypothetical protein [Opitutus sp. ER46]|uniref:hypothetical protein n=1 Tax=Opitutus sp. ER46 TaxID=2161864 RepID=UPI000D30BB34|nr:hypothetical protein [Opitutus sp. ER46]PTX96523.1 hypothetical protein DB354_07655 [Opitutus sp. ER46]
MFRALFFKEWIKLRLWWTLLAVASLVYAGFLALRLRHVFAVYDAPMVWSSWIYKAYLFFGPFKYVPLGLGVTLAVLQFLPEVQQHRIRLVLHLPLGEIRAVALHLAAGLLLLSILVLPAVAVLAAVSTRYFPTEMLTTLWLTALPWVLAGYAGYLVGTAALLEASWRGRVILLLLGAAALRLFFEETFYQSYLRVLPAFAAWAVAVVLLPLHASDRFRKGLV